MPTLYLTKQDSVLHKVDERLKVTHKREKLLEIPLIKVSQVVVFGRITITAATIRTLMESNIELCYLTQYGRFIGRLQPSFSKNSLLRREQYQAACDSERSLEFARAFVMGKIANMRVLLVRSNRSIGSTEINSAMDRIKKASENAESVDNIDSLRGYEGESTAAYFNVFDQLIKQDGFSFEKRIRRPPTDPINSMLSFGYTLLANDIHSAINIVGFDPYIGFLHADRYGRPSLALDLMEEFRPLIVDSFVLTCINKRIISPSDFNSEMGNCRLTDKARQKFLKQYEARKQTEIKHPIFGYKVTYQKCFELQARFLGKSIQGEIEQYPAFVTK